MLPELIQDPKVHYWVRTQAYAGPITLNCMDISPLPDEVQLSVLKHHQQVNRQPQSHAKVPHLPLHIQVTVPAIALQSSDCSGLRAWDTADLGDHHQHEWRAGVLLELAACQVSELAGTSKRSRGAGKDYWGFGADQGLVYEYRQKGRVL